MHIPAEQTPLPLRASTLSQLADTIVGNLDFCLHDRCGNQLHIAYSGRQGSAVTRDLMRFTSEFIVSWVDFGVNPLAVSQSISRMGSACF
jgi:hypothetical protein